MDAEFAKIAYENSLRWLDEQAELVSNLRGRTGILFAASSLAASFLGPPAVEDGSTAWKLLALFAFVASLATSLYVLVPRRTLAFSLPGSELFERLYERRGDIPDVYRRLTYELDALWSLNDREIQLLTRAFQISAASLVAEVVFLLVSTGGILG